MKDSDRLPLRPPPARLGRVALLLLSWCATHEAGAAAPGTVDPLQEPAAGRLLGSMVDPGGEPARLPVALVQVAPGEEWRIAPLVTPHSRFPALVDAALPGEDGRFELADVPPGSWRLAHYTLGAYHFTEPFAVSPGAAVDVGAIPVATRSPAHWVRGRIPAGPGSPAMAICGVFWWRPGHDGSVRLPLGAPPGGEFALPLPVAGEEVSLLVLRGRESYSFAEGVPVPSEGVELPLCPLRTVAVRLEDAEWRGAPISRVQVAIVESTGRALDLGLLDSYADSVPIPDERFLLRLSTSGGTHLEAGPFDPGQVGDVLRIRDARRAPPLVEVRRPPAPTPSEPSPSMQSADPRERALALAVATNNLFRSHLGSWEHREFERRNAKRVTSSGEALLRGRLTFGGEPWFPEPTWGPVIHCGMGLLPVQGRFAGLVPADQPLEEALWSPVEFDGRFTLHAPAPGSYRLLVSNEVDPTVRGLDFHAQQRRLVTLDLVEIGGDGPTSWDRDLPVGGLRVRRNQGGSDRLLVWTAPGGLSGILGLDRDDDRLEYRIPCVPAGPAEVVQLLPDGSLRVLASLIVPPGGTAEVDLR